MHTFNGSGSFRYVLFGVGAEANSHLMEPRIYIDGTRIVPSMAFTDLDLWGFDKTTRPFQLLEYNLNGVNRLLFYVEKGLVFDTSISFRLYNGADVSIGANAYWFYQAL